MDFVAALVLDVLDFSEFLKVLFIEFKEEKIVDMIGFSVIFFVRELSEGLDIENGATLNFVGYLKLQSAFGKIALNLKPQDGHFGFVVMVDELDDIVNSEAEHAWFLESITGEVVHVFSELVVNEDCGG